MSAALQQGQSINHLHRVLQLVFHQQAAEVGRLLSPRALHGDQDAPRLEHWPERLAATTKPLVTQLFQRGIVESRRRIAALRGGRPAAAMLRPPQRIVVHPRHTFGERRKKLGSELGVTFDLFDPLVLRAVDKATMRFCEETNDTAVGDLKAAIKELRRLMKEGLPEGKAVAQLAREVKRIFADPSRAYRIAATESSRAVHGGALLNAKESSLKLWKEWLASSNACELCLDLDGVQKELDEPFTIEGTGPYARIMTPPRHPHCLLPETSITAARPIAAMKAFFSGPCVRVAFSNGDHLSCTPNHMLLTPLGFLRAEHLVDGDDVVCCSNGQRVGIPDPYNDNCPTSIQQVFDSFTVASGMSANAVPASAEYFHGDGAFCQGNVEVVRTDGFLWYDREFGKPFQKQVTHAAFQCGRSAGHFIGDCSLTLGLEALRLATFGSTGTARDRHSLLLAELRHRYGLLFGLGTELDVLSNEQFANDSVRYAEITGNVMGRLAGLIPYNDAEDLVAAEYQGSADPCGLRLSAEPNACSLESVFKGPNTLVPQFFREGDEGFSQRVTVCKVLQVERFHYDGPVYDLETVDTLFIVAHGIVVGNCF